MAAKASSPDGWGAEMGAHSPMFTGLLVYGLAGGAGQVTDDYTLLVVGRVVFGVGATMAFAATTVAFLNDYRGADRHLVLGIGAGALALVLLFVRFPTTRN